MLRGGVVVATLLPNLPCCGAVLLYVRATLLPNLPCCGAVLLYVRATLLPNLPCCGAVLLYVRATLLPNLPCCGAVLYVWATLITYQPSMLRCGVVFHSLIICAFYLRVPFSGCHIPLHLCRPTCGIPYLPAFHVRCGVVVYTLYLPALTIGAVLYVWATVPIGPTYQP